MTTTFVLVHGAWHGSWAWERVASRLHQAGARTITPTLTEANSPGLDDHVREIVGVLDSAAAESSDEDELVLVGHSYGGLVVRQAADQRPELVRHLVLIDGWAGGDGAGVFTLAPAPFVDAIRAMVTAGGDERYVPAPAPAAFGITEPGDADWLAARLRPQSLRTFTDVSRLTGAVEKVPGTAIFCRPQTYPFEQLATDLGYRTVAVDGPHNVMLTAPDELAALLLDVDVRS
ncbi:alpha/beta fold hydrolase [Kribbella sp. NPDC051586]|uniref:alpha/beta fold hydrolase n=1 Tax=Kribbella sp. NPDC051586 TaxID=3364118 RepID=UPI0037B08194